MSKQSDYDWNAIEQDYVDGLSLSDLNNKYGVSVGHASRKLRTRGVKMHHYSYKVYKEWKKLIPSGLHNAALLINVPKFLLKKLNFDTSCVLEGKWIISDGCLKLTIREKTVEAKERKQNATS
jgi:hypothetical protein